MIFEKVCELIAEQFSVDAATITMETSFEDDLGADSLDIVELSMACLIPQVTRELVFSLSD